MDPVDVLLGMAEISIAMVGFTGIVGALRLTGDAWSTGTLLSFWIMVELSLACVALSLVPVALLAFDLTPRTTWLIGSGVMIGFIALHMGIVGRRVLAEVRDGNRSPWLPRVIGPLFLATLATLVASVTGIIATAFGPYLVALLLLFGIAAVSFVALLASFIAAQRAENG
ncbi:MAG TPA: hypothetical protein VLA56_05820 [Pseudomonadales bacterium]|nr:hypothetical protein [Pseudomonadales bacterium]